MQLHRKQWLRHLKTLQPLLNQSMEGKIKIYPKHIVIPFLGGEIRISHAGWDDALAGEIYYKAFFGVLNKAPEAMLEINKAEGDKIDLAAEGAVYTIPFMPTNERDDVGNPDAEKAFLVSDISYGCGAVLAATTHEDFECYLVKEKGEVKLKLFDGFSYGEALLPGDVSPTPYSFKLSEHVVKFLASAHVSAARLFPYDSGLYIQGTADGNSFTLYLSSHSDTEPLWDDLLPEELSDVWYPMSTALNRLPRLIELVTATGQDGKSCPIKMSYINNILELDSLAETEVSVELADIHADGLDRMTPFEIVFDALLVKNILSFAREWQILDGQYLLFKDDGYALYCVSTLK